MEITAAVTDLDYTMHVKDAEMCRKCNTIHTQR